MLDILTDAEVAGGLIWEPQVSSWLEGEWLADVPVSSGSVTWSTRREIPGSIELVVPRLVSGFDWAPGRNADHPLAHKGQVLRASVKITLPVSKRVVVARVGTFRITGSTPDGGSVRVVGQSMFKLIVDARLKRPMGSRTSGTLASELRRLVPASMGVAVDDGLTDRACPRMTWGESRIGAVQEIARAWPARLRETTDGRVTVLPPLADVPTPTVTLTDGAGGTVVSAYPDGSDDGLHNVVVVRGTETDDAGEPLIQEEAAQTTGPLRVSRFGEKPTFFASPLVTRRSTALATAQTMLADAVRESITVPVVCASDPRWELDDAVEVLADGETWWGYVSGIQLPLTHQDGDMRLDVEVSS